jgi:dihydroneopterin aldolase
VSIIQTITITQLEILASIGLYEEEKQKPQRVLVDVEATLDPQRPHADSFEDIVCYHKLSKKIEALFAQGHIHTLEKAAYDITDIALEHSRVQEVSVRLHKPDIITHAQSVGVTLTRRR